MTDIRIDSLRHTYPHPLTSRPFCLQCDKFIAPEGQLTCLVGPNGGGKTTLLKIIGGRLLVSIGTVLFNDVNATGLRSRSALRSNVAYIDASASTNLADELLVIDHLAMGLAVHNELPCMFPRSEKAVVVIKEALDRYSFNQLYPFFWKRVTELSSGLKQMVALAVALMNGRTIILADESTSNLDVANSRSFFERVREVVQTRAATAIVATHDLYHAVQFANRLYVVKSGIVMEYDSSDGRGEAEVRNLEQLIVTE